MVGRARAQLDERVGPAAGGDRGRLPPQDLGLPPGRVVLRQPGDLVEELRAAVVVEPLRRQQLGHGGEAGADVGPQRLVEVGGAEVDVDGRAGLRWARVLREVRGSGVAGAAEAGEDLAADGVVPVAERGADGARVGRPGPARAAPCTRRRRRPRSTPGRGRRRSRDRAEKSLAVHSHTSPIICPRPARAGARRVGADGRRAEVALAQVGVLDRGGSSPHGMAALAAAARVPAGRLLPLRLGGQAPTRPAGVGVGLVPADVLDRLVERQRLEAWPKRVPHPASGPVRRPELRVAGVLRLSPRPPLRSPPAAPRRSRRRRRSRDRPRWSPAWRRSRTAGTSTRWAGRSLS